MKGVAIGLSALRGPIYVKADREKLRRVIMNIVDNSLKYMDKAERNLWVELSSHTPGRYQPLKLASFLRLPV